MTLGTRAARGPLAEPAEVGHFLVKINANIAVQLGGGEGDQLGGQYRRRDGCSAAESWSPAQPASRSISTPRRTKASTPSP
jgi:hypothetical protein